MNNTAITVGNKHSEEEACVGVQALAFAVSLFLSGHEAWMCLRDAQVGMMTGAASCTSLQVCNAPNNLTGKFRSGNAKITEKVLLRASGDISIVPAGAACCCVCKPVDQTGGLSIMETWTLCVKVQQRVYSACQQRVNDTDEKGC